MEIQELITKLSKPHWMLQDPRMVVRNLTPEHIGQLNLMWVFLEYPTLYSEDEFYRFICQHPDVFGRFLKLAMWKKHFVKKRLAGC